VHEKGASGVARNECSASHLRDGDGVDWVVKYALRLLELGHLSSMLSLYLWLLPARLGILDACFIIMFRYSRLFCSLHDNFSGEQTGLYLYSFIL